MAEATELVARLRERTAMRYMGDRKCGKCQLVPRAMIDEAADALERLSAPVELETTAFDRGLNALALQALIEVDRRVFDGDPKWLLAVVHDADKAARLQAEVERLRALLPAPKGDTT